MNLSRKATFSLSFKKNKETGLYYLQYARANGRKVL